MTIEKYCRKTVRGRIRDFFADRSVNQFDAWKWGGLLLIASTLAMLALAGCVSEAPTYVGPRFSQAGAVALTGTGAPGSLVEILDENGNRIDTTTVGTNGQWSVPADFEVGNHNLSVRAISRARDNSNPNNPLVLAEGNRGKGVLTTYGLPSINLPTGDLNPGLITLAGVGTAGALMELFADGVSLGQVEVGPDGKWSLDADLPDAGSYDISANLLDPDGNVLGQISGQKLNLIAGFVPLTANGRVNAGTIAPSGDAASGPLSWSGTGMPGRTVEFLVNGEVVGETVIGPDGTWSFSDLDSDLKYGNNLLTARMVDENGNPLGRPITDTLFIKAPEEPVVEDPAPDSDYLVTIDSVDTNADGVTTLTGTATPGATVTIYVNGTAVGTVLADEAGNWSLSGYFPAGDHDIQAKILGDDDAILADSSSVPFSVSANGWDGAAPAAGSALVKVISAGEAEARADGTFDDRFLSGSAAISMILDASWSMTFPTDSSEEADRLSVSNPNNRINIAKGELVDLINETIPEGTPVTMRSLGNRGGNLACVTALEYPLQGMDRTALAAAIQDVTPGFNTNTPLAATLLNVPSDLADAGDRERVVILLTDGEEKCGGDVDAAIDALIADGISLRLNIIGFAVNDEDVRSKLQTWAQQGNGFYFDATDASALGDALVNSLASVYQLIDTDGETVATGVVGSDPIEVAPGIYTIRITSVEGLTTSTVVVPSDSAVQITVK